MGFSGLASCSLYLMIKKANTQFKYVALGLIPLNMAILLLFLWIDSIKTKKIEFDKMEKEAEMTLEFNLEPL